MSEAWQPTKNAALTGTLKENTMLLREAMHIPLNEDVIERTLTVVGKEATLYYIDGMADDEKLQRFVMQPLLNAPPCTEDTEMEDHLTKNVLPVGAVTKTTQMNTLLTRVYSGDAVILIDSMPGAIIFDVKGFVKRGIQPPVNEAVIVGPQEGFNESLRDNVTLMRRIMRTPALISEQTRIGTKIPSRVCLLYLDGIARKEVIEETKRRIEGCNVDYVSGAGMLEQLIEDHPYSLLPQVISTERPDRAASFLLEGQILIAMENANEMLGVPMGLLHLYHAPDDTAMRWQYGTFLRLIRLIGILLSLFLPAVFVALTTHHVEGMSLPLLTSVFESQARIPISIFTSAIMLLVVFSLINEAGTRVPGVMGGSLSIVSALILGQAAVSADLISPLILIVVAISGLGSFAVPSYPLSVALRIMQIVLVLAAGMAGYFGIVLCVFWMLCRICGMTSFHMPYTAPIAPLRPANPDRILRLPVWRQRLHGFFSNPYTINRVNGKMRAWDNKK